MAFSVNLDRRRDPAPRQGSAMSGTTFLVVFGALFALFCIYDYSSYGSGTVAHTLGVMQRAFQGFVLSFRLRM